MGTRSTIKFYSEFAPEVIVLSVYQQFDGYISGVGHELAEWLKDKKIINGINGINGQTMSYGYANGMGCLAAQFVASFKKEIGGFYLVGVDNTQEYNYEVRWVGNQFEITVDAIFKGTPQELLNFDQE